jgi:predicted O-methyltransferase YrrM
MPTYSDALSDYIQRTFAQEDEVLREVRRHSLASGLPEIHIRPEEGRFLQFLAAAGRARRALEIGTLGGYSGVWIARGLAPRGRLVTLEREPEHARVARENFTRAGLSRKVEIRVGDALVLLRRLAREAPFDFVFVDADKREYPAYLRWALRHLARPSVLVAHNAFRRGALLDDRDKTPEVTATREFLTELSQAAGSISTVFPAGDGMAVAALRAGPG